MKVTVIICTKDRPESLRRTLQSLLSGIRLPEEILLVDDGALDPQLVAGWLQAPGVATKYFHKQTPGLTASRNLGVAHADGDILVFLDDDVILEPGYLAAILDVFSSDPHLEVGGVTGALKYAYQPGVRLFLRLFLMDGSQPGKLLPSGFGVLVRQGEIQEIIPVDWLSGCNMAYRRQVFEYYRFDQRLGAYGWGEDRDFSVRVGQRFKLVATPHARLVHLKDPNSRIPSHYLGFMETNYLWRFFIHNMPHSVLNYLALGWSILGILLKNMLRFITGPQRRPVLAQIRGNIKGLWAVFRNQDYQP